MAEAKDKQKPTKVQQRAWYVVQTASGHENKVKEHIEKRVKTLNIDDKIFNVIVPEKDVTRIRDGKRIEKKEREFPGYVLIEMVMDDESWRIIKGTPGVTRFIGANKQPLPIPPSEVRRILRKSQVVTKTKEGKKIIDVVVGESVKIQSGPFEDFIGEITEINEERETLKALVSIFGRSTPVELAFDQIAKL